MTDPVLPTEDHVARHPTPLDVGELARLRVDIQRMMSTILAKLAEVERLRREDAAAFAAGLKLEFQGIRNEIAELRDRERDTGRHIIQLAEGVGEAKGFARRPRSESLNPGAIIVNVFGKFATHVVGKELARWAAASIGMAGLLKLLHWLRWW